MHLNVDKNNTLISGLSQDKLVVEEKIQRVFQSSAMDLGLESGKVIKLEYNSQHGYYFRVTLKEEPILRQNKKYQIIDAIKGGCRFTTEKLSDLSERFKKVISDYEEAQKSCVAEIFEVASKLNIKGLSFKLLE